MKKIGLKFLLQELTSSSHYHKHLMSAPI